VGLGSPGPHGRYVYAAVPSMPADPSAFRSRFPVLARLSYLNAGTEGPVPRAAQEAVERRIAFETQEGRCGRP
jgi:hypothetical protein